MSTRSVVSHLGMPGDDRQHSIPATHGSSARVNQSGVLYLQLVDSAGCKRV
jgi:hypothetical protein